MRHLSFKKERRSKVQQNFKRPKEFYVREHELYYTPYSYYVEYMLSKRKLQSGETNVKQAQELARFFYHKMLMEKNIAEPEYVDASLITDERLKGWVEQKEGFYQMLWEKYIPGLSALDKALNLLALLKKNKKSQNIEQVSEDDLSQVIQNTPGEEMFESHTLNMLIEQTRGIEEFDKKIDMLQKISAIEAFGKSFEIKKMVHDKKVHNSQAHKSKRMTEYSDLSHVDLYQRMLPNFSAKLATKDLTVNTPIEALESKQKIIILVDFSGSMREDKKQEWVLSILADRLSYCMKEECEIFFSFFLTLNDLKNGNFQFTHIYNEETAVQFFKTFNILPSGGDTQVGDIVNAIRDEIMDNHRLFNLDVDLSKEQPEILIINDGNDSVKTEKVNWKTNAITLYADNKQLEKLCKKTDGKYVHINT